MIPYLAFIFINMGKFNPTRFLAQYPIFHVFETFGSIIFEVISLLLFSLFVYLNKFYRLFIRRPLKTLDNEIILITGTGNGIGKQLALQLCEVAPKSILICLDNEENANEETVQKIRQKNVQVLGFCIDISNRELVSSLARKIKYEIGQVTIIINNAGIIGPTGAFLLQSPDTIIKTFEVNLFSQFWVLIEFLPDMIRKNHGHIVTIASLASLLPTREIASYASSKYAIHGFIESLKRELRSTCNINDHHGGCNNIQFTTVYPGIVQTRISEAIRVSPRFPVIFPKIITAEYVAKITIEGFRRNQEYLYLPSPIAQLLAMLTYILPTEIQQKVENGLYRCELEHMNSNSNVKVSLLNPSEVNKGNSSGNPTLNKQFTQTLIMNSAPAASSATLRKIQTKPLNFSESSLNVLDNVAGRQRKID